MVTCMGDISDAISHHGFSPSDPYPQGLYNCQLDYYFPSSEKGSFSLELTKMEAQSWYMTLSDIQDDLEALWYAIMWFDEIPGTVPSMDISIRRFRLGSSGPTFLASQGHIAFYRG